MLLDLLLLRKTTEGRMQYVSDNPYVDVAYFPKDKALVASSVSSEEVETTVLTAAGEVQIKLMPHEMKICKL